MPSRVLPEPPTVTVAEFEALETRVKTLETLLVESVLGAGYKIQFGFKEGTTDGGGNIEVLFPTPFPSSLVAVVAVGHESTDPLYRIGFSSVNGFIAFFNAAAHSNNFYWIAIGR